MEPLTGWLLALPAFIRLERKRLTVTNTLAYYGTELMIGIKSFIVNAPEHEITI